MKRFLITAALSSMFISPVLGATTDSFLLEGIVPKVQSIEITPSPVHDNLNLSQTFNDLVVAEVLEKSNSASGYQIVVESQNGGQLENGQLDSLSYTMKYDGTDVNLTSGSVTLSTTNVFNTGGKVSEIMISYVGKDASEMIEGSYTDTVTVSIVSN